MTIPPFRKELRVQPRRMSDRATEDLYKTFSTPHCHACIERVGNAVLLLDHERRPLYATTKMHAIINNPNKLFTLTPRFSLFTRQNTSRIEAFFNRSNNPSGPLALQLTNENNRAMLLMTCFRLPEPSIPNLSAAMFLIKLHDVNQYSDQHWLFFAEQFALTQAEVRLCRALTDGMTLNDYRLNGGITISTARSQLSSIFSKTATRRQIDLLRLINLLLRT
ncbi:helix-turn-helix transcriptional regulator [Nitrosomonas ureae]|uniref:DNA-binding transcriptional regulator, CsgD family n=1 Tax=Nitrosomonas ureae TaxID=44577 RepID=A0A1H2FL01_9PROT|nr:hypothetical protein [Nitrosomonas ureae]SDU07982.1 hypothetical protein SAMN05216406_12233 [Nitrosomonas ureae]